MTLLMGTCRLTHQSDGIFYPAILQREHRLETQHERLILGGNTPPPPEMTIIMELKLISAVKDCTSLKMFPSCRCFFFFFLSLINTTCPSEREILRFSPRNRPLNWRRSQYSNSFTSISIRQENKQGLSTVSDSSLKNAKNVRSVITSFFFLNT